LESLVYIAIYTLEAFCILSASYMLFRFPFKEFIGKKLILSFLLAAFSYFLRDITIVNVFTIIVPLTYQIAITLFITLVSRIRIVWASIMMITGQAIVGTVQMAILLLFDVFGITMAKVQGSLFYLVLAQLITAAIVFSGSFLYYFRGSGFTYDFPAWRWKHLWLVLLVIILVALLLRFVLINNLVMIIAVAVTFTILFILSKKLDKEEAFDELEP